ncbi:hypothetical protein QE152_g10271 [Popillia japonica]|uniref:Uncharacterized protein n=1 Tax=Popillia japonica TaxID=7064 RepID=A0AAW1LVW8_POPJA
MNRKAEHTNLTTASALLKPNGIGSKWVKIRKLEKLVWYTPWTTPLLLVMIKEKYGIEYEPYKLGVDWHVPM